MTAVSARDRTRDRGVDLSGLRWYENAPDLVADPDVDVVVELIGGAEGTARAVVEAALAAGKPVVTANKALLAIHGPALARLSAENPPPYCLKRPLLAVFPPLKWCVKGWQRTACCGLAAS